MLGKLRQNWIESFDEIRKEAGADDVDDHNVLAKIVADRIDALAGWKDPPFSVRLDAFIRTYALLSVRSMKKKHAYDPRSEKKRNDGIDIDTLQYLAAPMLICVNDEKFTNAVADSGSIQRAWMLTPVELAEACRKGTLPTLPNWSGHAAAAA